jgi:pimeloyl-ACP methyl ester carboxylesterase
MKRLPAVVLGLLFVLLAGCSQTDEGLQNGDFTAQLNGFDIFYTVHGKGPVCMALPNSWGLSHQALRVLYRPLEEHLTMVYFDPRGMGKSGDVREEADMSMATVREDLNALRLHLGLGKVNIIGWSNGGMNLLLFAAEHPEVLSTAIIVHSAASFGEEDMNEFAERNPDLMQKYSEFMSEMTEGGLTAEEKEVKYRDFSVTMSFPAMVADRDRGEELLKEFFAETELSWKHSFYTETVDSPVFDAREELGRITVPALVIAGAQDLMPVSKAEEIANGIENSTLVIFENSGHFSQLEEPEKFVSTVLDFLGIAE